MHTGVILGFQLFSLLEFFKVTLKGEVNSYKISGHTYHPCAGGDARGSEWSPGCCEDQADAACVIYLALLFILFLCFLMLSVVKHGHFTTKDRIATQILGMSCLS